MDIYYLFNSGFTVICDNGDGGRDALIFDYYKGGLAGGGGAGAGGDLRAPLPEAPDSYGGIYCFASHSHPDHFNPKIFSWLAERKDIRYILSDDIGQQIDAARLEKLFFDHGADIGNVSFIHRGDTVNAAAASGTASGIVVKAYGSTDAGVSFHVLLSDGTDIFHAGDLNYWHWSDESTGEEVNEASRAFTKELDLISAGINKIDVAFFPVDPRMGSDYYRGAVMFCERMKPGLLVPMHFSSSFNPPGGFFVDVKPYTSVAGVGSPGSKVGV